MELIQASRLSDDDAKLIRSLTYRLARLRKPHRQWDDYYRGRQVIQSIGIAVPAELRSFVFPLNWPRIVVDSVVQRQQVKSFSMPDDDKVSNELRELWEYNNMESQQVLLHTETRVQGHGFVCVGANPDDSKHPLISVESSRNMIARIDPRTRTVESALRVYFNPWENGTPDYATLYTPEYTLWLEKQHGKWMMTGRNDHHLGVVPVVQFLNRPRAGDFLGESEMADVVQPTDMAARAILDLQIAMETHAVPGKWAIGVTHNDFIDAKTGKPASAIKTYFNSMLTSKNANAKFGQFTASDLSNFKTVIDLLSEQMSAITGLPMRYFGMNTANPAAEGAIRADELRLVKNVELKNAVDGDSWSQVMAVAHKLATGDDINANLVRCDWEDPNTPTYAQRADAITKLMASGILSREGAWDELGWSEARKDKEREYFAKQISESYGQYMKDVDYGADDGGTDAAHGSDGAEPPAAQPQQPSGGDGAQTVA